MSDLDVVLERIANAGKDDLNDTQPLPAVVERAIHVVRDAATLSGVCGRASVAVCDDGSLVVYWRLRRRKLHAMFYADDTRDRIFYHQDDHVYGIEILNIEMLAQRLRWESGET